MNHEDLVIGKTYKIKCGWGLTRAKLLGYISYRNGYRYEWQDMKQKIFTFCSYDLEDTQEV